MGGLPQHDNSNSENIPEDCRETYTSDERERANGTVTGKRRRRGCEQLYDDIATALFEDKSPLRKRNSTCVQNSTEMQDYRSRKPRLVVQSTSECIPRSTEKEGEEILRNGKNTSMWHGLSVVQTVNGNQRRINSDNAIDNHTDSFPHKSERFKRLRVSQATKLIIHRSLHELLACLCRQVMLTLAYF